jgi:hypothetical protein
VNPTILTISFMWDFVGRTIEMLYFIPPTTSVLEAGSAFADVSNRSYLAAQLLLDTEPGMLDMTVQSGPHDAELKPEIGDDIKVSSDLI